MPTPAALRDTITEGIRVGATAFFLPLESHPERHRYVFGYRIVIMNEGTRTLADAAFPALDDH